MSLNLTVEPSVMQAGIGVVALFVGCCLFYFYGKLNGVKMFPRKEHE